MAILTTMNNSAPPMVLAASSGKRRRSKRISFTRKRRSPAAATTEDDAQKDDRIDLLNVSLRNGERYGAIKLDGWLTADDVSTENDAHPTQNEDGEGEGGEDDDGSDHTARTVDTALEDAIPSLTDDHDDEVPKTRVHFSTVTIREYPRALGDNPSVSSGAPLTLKWRHASSVTLDLNAYELSRPPLLRRERGEMIVPHFQREEWLRDAGYSRVELREAARAAVEIRAQRRKSAGQSEASMKAEAFRESFGRLSRRGGPKNARSHASSSP